jgi:transposase InsO family protein
LEEYRVTTPDASRQNGDKKIGKRQSQQEKDSWFRRKMNAVHAAESKGVLWVAERVGRSARTVYRWIETFKRQGPEGLRGKSTRPKNPRRLPREKVERIVDLRLATGSGCEKIAFEVGCSASSVHKELRRLGLIWKEGRRTRFRSFQRKHANTLWQLDFTMLREDLWLLLVMDDHSRFIVAHRLMATPNAKATLAALRAAFSVYGVPKQVLTDHGSQFYSLKGGVPAFDRMCLDEGSQHILSAVRHPQTLGKLERKNGVLKDFLARRADALAWTESEISSLIDHFVEEHNYSRWHFAYETHILGSVRKRRKVLFLPYLRFVCHRG